MTIAGYSKDEFGRKLATVVSAARPIRSIEHLKGREEKLEEISRTLYAEGRHIFIYGDRGVGKSSLAATAAFQYQSSDAEPIFVSGSQDETFSSIIANIAVQALSRSKTDNVTRHVGRSIEFRGLSWSKGTEISPLDIANQIRSVSDATELLKQIAAKHSSKPAVVLDEFDAIPDLSERSRFASLLKQMGDQSIDLKFFITGVGQSCTELLGAHQSAHRQLATIELRGLGFEARREIVIDALEAFDLEINNNVNWRIAIISDGFPYYVHLIVEKMLWEAFASDKESSTLSWEEFYGGLRVAINEANAELRQPYEKAVLHREPEYEDVVWSTADGEDLHRSINMMRSSYQRIRSKREGRPDLDAVKFSTVVRNLKQPGFGAILEPIAKRSGWYIYREKMLRGYVRMQAEANRVELSGEEEAPKQVMHIPNIRTGHHGPTIPRGVQTGRPLEDEE